MLAWGNLTPLNWGNVTIDQSFPNSGRSVFSNPLFYNSPNNPNRPSTAPELIGNRDIGSMSLNEMTEYFQALAERDRNRGNQIEYYNDEDEDFDDDDDDEEVEDDF